MFQNLIGYPIGIPIGYPTGSFYRNPIGFFLPSLIPLGTCTCHRGGDSSLSRNRTQDLVIARYPCYQLCYHIKYKYLCLTDIFIVYRHAIGTSYRNFEKSNRIFQIPIQSHRILLELWEILLDFPNSNIIL